MKIWEKDVKVNSWIEQFTVGLDRELDYHLAKSDVLGSMAHTTMLQSIDLLTADELVILKRELKKIYDEISSGNFAIEDDQEDVHSQIESMLTERVGDIGKKIHSGRSRNDQVLVDLKLYMRDEIKEIIDMTKDLFDILISQAETHKDVIIPGYTHLQVAMPSSFGLWFSAYAESLIDDLYMMEAAYKICNQNPLGSAAGYGSSFPLDRDMTTKLLGFDSMNYNVVYAQMGRGKVEKSVGFGISSIAATLSKMAMDVCLYMSQNFNFLSLPAEMTTGSSIMPHKKNPDVFELLRSHCNRLQNLPAQITLMINNLPSGYFRDLQLVKEEIVPAFQEIKDCLNIATFAIKNLEVNRDIVEDPRYIYMYSVEELNKNVLSGTPFRDAYRDMGRAIERGEFNPSKSVNHTHKGSIGNLCLDLISNKMDNQLSKFNFKDADCAITELLNSCD